MSIVISPNFEKCINMRDHTSGSSIKPLRSDQAYEPYKADGLWSRGSFGELCLVPNPINTRSEHVHINLSALIPSAITLYSALSFTEHMHVFVTKIWNFSKFHILMLALLQRIRKVLILLEMLDFMIRYGFADYPVQLFQSTVVFRLQVKKLRPRNGKWCH